MSPSSGNMAPHVVKETPDDALGVYAVVKAAFKRVDEATLVDALRTEGAVLMSLVAKIGDVIVGHVLFSRVWIETDDGRLPAVSLAPLAVASAFQNTGIGSLLVYEGLARLKGEGENLVLVLGHANYYPRFGFRADAAANFEAPWPSGPSFMALTFGPDAPVRGRAVFAAAFDELE